MLVMDVLANTERILEVEEMLVDSITTEFYSISITLVTSERCVPVINQTLERIFRMLMQYDKEPNTYDY